ncbi:MAG: hypothetical protein MNPFHGCM_01136 [Gemmatimonadaceae bacterium]|nr:hypothetical protein [Gemmatimonadaceae bacterium]
MKFESRDAISCPGVGYATRIAIGPLTRGMGGRSDCATSDGIGTGVGGVTTLGGSTGAGDAQPGEPRHRPAVTTVVRTFHLMPVS